MKTLRKWDIDSMERELQVLENPEKFLGGKVIFDCPTDKPPVTGQNGCVYDTVAYLNNKCGGTISSTMIRETIEDLWYQDNLRDGMSEQEQIDLKTLSKNKVAASTGLIEEISERTFAACMGTDMTVYTVTGGVPGSAAKELKIIQQWLWLILEMMAVQLIMLLQL